MWCRSTECALAASSIVRLINRLFVTLSRTSSGPRAPGSVLSSRGERMRKWRPLHPLTCSDDAAAPGYQRTSGMRWFYVTVGSCYVTKRDLYSVNVTDDTGQILLLSGQNPVNQIFEVSRLGWWLCHVISTAIIILCASHLRYHSRIKQYPLISFFLLSLSTNIITGLNCWIRHTPVPLRPFTISSARE